MASKVTSQDIIRFNELYLKLKTYSAVARETGFSASTVKKYIKDNYRPQDEIKIKRFRREDLPRFNPHLFENCNDFGGLCVLSDEELEEIHELWDELSI